MAESFGEILERKKRGSLKIYLGYAPGVGKTSAMLHEAQRLKDLRFDIVLGLVEGQNRPDIMAQIKQLNLETIPLKIFKIVDSSFSELDQVAIIARNPQIVLIDELPHTNARGSVNEKRYQDILELLEHGINVITTLNIQHLESVAERVVELTGLEVKERVPDNLMKMADQIVTVDIPIEELRERLRSGKIYKKGRAEHALLNFFSRKNLSMLREAAIQQAASNLLREGLLNQQMVPSNKNSKDGSEKVVIYLSSDPFQAEGLIRRGIRMAALMSAHCLVVNVQTKMDGPTAIDAGVQRKIQNIMVLAKNLGAEVVTLQGEDVAETLVNYTVVNNVKHVIFGKSRLSPFKERLYGSVILDFSYDAIGVDIHILSNVEGNADDAF